MDAVPAPDADVGRFEELVGVTADQSPSFVLLPDLVAFAIPPGPADQLALPV